MSQERFGKLPSGKRLEKIRQSPNYRDGAFQNISPTPDLTEGATYWTVGKKFFFGKDQRSEPQDLIPSMKTDLFSLDPDQNILVWFGHSSYFMQIDGMKILVDPVLCGHASPFSFSTKAFKGSEQYTVEDIPEIDFLFISHDHYDHLDHKTIKQLKPKIKQIVCGLGTAEHLEYWGYDPGIIIEKDWNERFELGDFIVNTVPARHFSGRLFKRNQSLWMSYVLKTKNLNIFIGGDSGYDTHFAEIGDKFGPFDLVMLENGQYDDSWNLIHLMPDQFLQAAQDLKAKRVFPVHGSKFALANHAWDDPLVRITELNKKLQIPLITTLIGEPVYLNDNNQQFKSWWEGIK
jgi:L-ascorbate metabolism protein UlaG (beta-lactamase superfamily)